jgi:hypothetical protein
LTLEEPGKAYLVYATNSAPIRLSLSRETAKFALHKVRMDTGTVEPLDDPATVGLELSLPVPEGGKALFWFKRKTEEKY